MNINVFNVNGDERNLGTLVGFVTELGFHELYRNALKASDLGIGNVNAGESKVKIRREPGIGGRHELNYNAMIVIRPEDSFMADMPFYVIRVRKV